MPPLPNPARRLFVAAAAPLALLLILTGVYWKLVLSRQYTWLDAPDIAHHEIPRFQFQAREWSQGRIPLWDPHQWFGQPLLGQMTGAAYPPNWAFFLLAGRHARLRQGELHWYFVLVHLLAAVNAYALCRHLKCSRTASLTGGVLFSVGGFLGLADWPVVMNGAVWAPLVLLFLLRSVEGVQPLSSAALSGAALGLAWLSGHHEVPTYVSLAAAGAWAFFILRRGRPDWRIAGLAALSILFAGLAGGLQLVPGVEFGRLALRWAGVETPLGWKDPVPYIVHSRYSQAPSSLAGILAPGFYQHASPFLGAAGALLAALGVILRPRELAPRLLLALAVAGLLTALGGWTLLHGLLYALLPVLEKVRVPARAVVVFSLAAAPLAALGLDALFADRTAPHARRAGWIALALGAASLVAMVVAGMARRESPDDRFVLFTLFLLLSGGVIAAWRAGWLGARAAGFAFCLLVAAETGHVAQAGFPSLADPSRTSLWRQLSSADDVAQFLRRLPPPIRVDVDDREYPGNFGDWYGIDTTAGFAAGITANIFRARHYNEWVSNLLAISHQVSPAPTRPGQELLYTSPGGLKVFRNPGAFPRLWTVHQVKAAPDAQALVAALGIPGTDLRRTALVLHSPGPLEQCEGDRTAITRYEAGRVEFSAWMKCRGLAVLADTWFPGWQARVDGRRVELHQVYGALRGVVLEAGQHRVEMVYRPATALWGGAMTLAGVAGALLLWLFDRAGAGRAG